MRMRWRWRLRWRLERFGLELGICIDGILQVVFGHVCLYIFFVSLGEFWFLVVDRSGLRLDGKVDFL